MGASLLICINIAFYFAWSFEIEKFCMEEKLSFFELLLCNYWGNLFADRYLQLILFCVVIVVQTARRGAERA